VFAQYRSENAGEFDFQHQDTDCLAAKYLSFQTNFAPIKIQPEISAYSVLYPRVISPISAEISFH